MPETPETSAATHEHQWQDTGFSDLEDCAVEDCHLTRSATTGQVIDPDKVMPSAACSTCRHWTPPGERGGYRDAVYVSWDPDRTSEERDELAIRWHALYGVCGKAEFCPVSDELSLDDPPPMVTRDGSEYMATLFTLATHGCLAWEAKPDAHEHEWLFGVCIGNDCNVKEREAEDA